MDIVVILLLSFVPMGFYALVLWWIDRYEKEPLGLLVIAILWGAIPAIVMSLIFELILDIPLSAAVANPSMLHDLLGSAAIAPLVEEGTKGAALLAMFLFWRRELDSPLDGLIYGGMVGFGFAAVENFFYLLGAYDGGGMEGALGLALFRAGLFGLNHAMFTGFTGVGIALALEADPRWLRPVLPLVGGALAFGAHAFHNSISTLAGYSESLALIGVLVIGDWLGVFCLLLIAGWALYLEQRRLARYLLLMEQQGLVPLEDLPMLRSAWRRGWTRAEALLGGNVSRWWQLGRYFAVVTEAAVAWQRQQRGDRGQENELARLEQEVVRRRQLLVGGGVALRQ